MDFTADGYATLPWSPRNRIVLGSMVISMGVDVAFRIVVIDILPVRFVFALQQYASIIAAGP